MMIISPHISEEKYRCKCCGKLPPSLIGGEKPVCYEWLFEDFEDIRLEYGLPIIIDSGYRCLAHNKEVGGEELSVHLFGLALDCSTQNKDDIDVLYNIVLAVHPELRIGLYKTKRFIHIDNGYEIYPRALIEWRKGARWTK